MSLTIIRKDLNIQINFNLTMYKIIIIPLILVTIFISGCTQPQNLNLPCGFSDSHCQMTSLGNFYDLDEAKDWDCEKMPGILSMVFSGNNKNLCMALKYKDSSYCDKIREKDKEITCRAIIKNNPLICGEITYESIKDKYYDSELSKLKKYVDEQRIFKELFELDAVFFNYLAEGLVDNQFREAFEKEGFHLSNDSTFYHDLDHNCWYLNGNNMTYIIGQYNSYHPEYPLRISVYADYAYAEIVAEKYVRDFFTDIVQSCYFQVGADNKNVEACKLLEMEINDSPKEICYREVNKKLIQDSLNEQNPSLCENQPEELLKISCYVESVKQTKDIGICNLLGKEDSINKCVFDSEIYNYIMNLAVQNKDANICKKFIVLKTNWKNSNLGYLHSCYGAVAGELNNPEICNGLAELYNTNETIKEHNIRNCLRDIK